MTDLLVGPRKKEGPLEIAHWKSVKLEWCGFVVEVDAMNLFLSLTMPLLLPDVLPVAVNVGRCIDM